MTVSTKGVRGTIWCGPWALAYLLGITYAAADKLLREYRQYDRKVTRTNHKELERLLCGRFISVPENPTLLQWFKANAKAGTRYMVRLRTHFVVVDGMRIIDNQSEAKQPVKQCRHKRKRVYSVMEVKA